MTGPEHYKEAESLVLHPTLSRAQRQLNPQPEEYESDELMLAAAQVHAILALTTTIASSFHDEASDPDPPADPGHPHAAQEQELTTCSQLSRASGRKTTSNTGH